jgi:hypothetical protein
MHGVNNSYGRSWYSTHGLVDKTVTWTPSDSEDRFEENMADPKKRAQLEKFGWTRDNVSYTFNQYGFRADQFTNGVNDSIVFLGCSHTVGIGVDLESTWAYKVASSLGLRRYNLGVGASSADTCFRLAHHWIPRLKPKYVIMLTPSHTRIEMVLEKYLVNFMPTMSTYIEKEYMGMLEGFYNGWLAHPANGEMNRLKNVMGVRTICNSLGGIPIIEIPSEETWYGELWRETLGRDLMHPGREWHERVAQTFIEKLP